MNILSPASRRPTTGMAGVLVLIATIAIQSGVAARTESVAQLIPASPVVRAPAATAPASTLVAAERKTQIDARHRMGPTQNSAARSRPTILEIKSAWGAHNYFETVRLLDRVAAAAPAIADQYAFYRYTALSHTNVEQLKQELRALLARSHRSLESYQRICNYLICCPGVSAANYHFGLALVNQGLERYGSQIDLLKAGARMSAWLGDRRGALTMQAEAILTTQEESPGDTGDLITMRRTFEGYRALPARAPKSRT